MSDNVSARQLIYADNHINKDWVTNTVTSMLTTDSSKQPRIYKITSKNLNTKKNINATMLSQKCHKNEKLD